MALEHENLGQGVHTQHDTQEQKGRKFQRSVSYEEFNVEDAVTVLYQINQGLVPHLGYAEHRIQDGYHCIIAYYDLSYRIENIYPRGILEHEGQRFAVFYSMMDFTLYKSAARRLAIAMIINLHTYLSPRIRAEQQGIPHESWNIWNEAPDSEDGQLI